MPFAEALARAGSFEVLLPHLREVRILARHHGLYACPGGEAVSGPGDIDPDFWAEARFDPATGRVILKKPDVRVQIRDISEEGERPGQLIVIPEREVIALDVDLERTAVETLFPVATVSTTPKPPARKRGTRPSPVWPQIFQHFDSVVAREGKFPSVYGAASSVEAFLKENGKSLSHRAIERGILKYRPDWITA